MSDFLLGGARESGRDIVLCLQGNRLQAAKWHQWKLHLFTQDDFYSTWAPNNIPLIYNLEWDPREEHPVDFPHAWVIHPMAAAAGTFLRTLAMEPRSSRGRRIPTPRLRPASGNPRPACRSVPSRSSSPRWSKHTTKCSSPITASSIRLDERRHRRRQHTIIPVWDIYLTGVESVAAAGVRPFSMAGSPLAGPGLAGDPSPTLPVPGAASCRRAGPGNGPDHALLGADAGLDLVARFLSTLRQYWKARCRTGSVTPLSRWPTTLLTRRSRAASSAGNKDRTQAAALARPLRDGRPANSRDRELLRGGHWADRDLIRAKRGAPPGWRAYRSAESEQQP